MDTPRRDKVLDGDEAGARMSSDIPLETHDFRALLRRYRLAAGLTQEELAERAGISARSISGMESGTAHRPRKDTLHLLAAALGLSSQEAAALGTAARPEHRTVQHVAANGPRGASPSAGKWQSTRPILPVPPTTLIGRERDIAEASSALRDDNVRLLTLVGPPGVGKTRLGLAVAAHLVSVFDGGVHFVSLAPLSESTDVVPAIARVMGVGEQGNRTCIESLIDVVDDQAILLVLDNFEHLAPAASDIAHLLMRSSRLKVLVTSRSAVHLRGEHTFAVTPLALPSEQLVQPLSPETLDALAGIPAIALFLDRARSVVAELALTPDNAEDISTICRQLDGLPLAIELAAARSTLLSPSMLRSRLDRRLSLLTGGARDLPERQQTLRNTLAWSHNLLSQDERRLFRRIAVFASGATLEAVSAVCYADDGSAHEHKDVQTINAVSSLVDNQLLTRDDGKTGELRVRMLETVREYAREHLISNNEMTSTYHAYATYFLTFAEQAVPHLTGQDQVAWIARLEAEYENLQGVLHWAQSSGDVMTALRLAAALWRFWRIRGRLHVGRSWLEHALAVTESLAEDLPQEAEVQCGTHDAVHTQRRLLLSTRARALHGLGTLIQRQGEHEQAEARLRDALTLWQQLADVHGMVATLNNLGINAHERGDYDRAMEIYEQCLSLWRQVGDKWGTASTLNNLGIVSLYLGNLDRATTDYTEAITLRRQLHDVRGLGVALNNLAGVLTLRGDYARAEDAATESVALSRTNGDTWSQGLALATLGDLARNQGDETRAQTFYVESLELMRAVGDRWNIAVALSGLAQLRTDCDDAEAAVNLWKQSLALWREIGNARQTAATLSGLGSALHALGKGVQAARAYRESLLVHRNMHASNSLAACLEGIAGILSKSDPLQAVRLLGAADALRSRLGTPRPPVEHIHFRRITAEIRASLGESVLTAARLEGERLPAEQAVISALSKLAVLRGVRRPLPITLPSA